MRHLSQVVAPIVARIESAHGHPFPDEQARMALGDAAGGDEPVRAVFVNRARQRVRVNV